MEKISFALKVNESKLSDANLANLSNQIQRVVQRLLLKVGDGYSSITIQAGMMNDDFTKNIIRLMITFNKTNDHEN